MNRKKENLPPLYDWVMQLPDRRVRDFFRLPVCPHCGTEARYRQVLGALPVQTVRCTHCAEAYRVRPGIRTAALALVLFLICLLATELILKIAEDVVPVVVFTLLTVIFAFFLHPYTLHILKKRKK